ncbi:hypothetical protein VV01_14665 [Luteipulveratus halotolerans]|uniref:Uncharacterized protein n=1 Tax=Luteipulveratus halotolerans TaxID=1631356 RepID=A0A0L6CKR1_9MICO|nr:hypothetical protein VV01_14665 [Luteipulveratus halotolerans]
MTINLDANVEKFIESMENARSAVEALNAERARANGVSVPSNHVSLSWDGLRNVGNLRINGLDVSQMVNRDLKIEVGDDDDFPTLTIHIPMETTDYEGLSHVEIPEDQVALLEQLGWTRPEGDA